MKKIIIFVFVLFFIFVNISFAENKSNRETVKLCPDGRTKIANLVNSNGKVIIKFFYKCENEKVENQVGTTRVYRMIYYNPDGSIKSEKFCYSNNKLLKKIEVGKKTCFDLKGKEVDCNSVSWR